MRLAALMLIMAMVTVSALPGAEPAGERPPRIALLFPQVIGIVFILDLAPSLVAVPKNQIGIADQEPGLFYSSFAPALAKTLDIGNASTPSVETLLKADPNLILASKAYSHTDMLLKVAEENKMAILRLEAGFGNIHNWISAVNEVAHATGRKTKAEAYTDFLKQKIELIQARLADTPFEKRPKVVLINTSGNQMIVRGARTTFGYELILAAGGRLMQHGKDPADSAGCAELLFSYDPDIIIDDSKVDIFYRASWWQELRAVKKGRVFKTPADDKQAWLTNWFLSTYSPLGLMWLAKIIHPQKFADINLKAEHEAFCTMLYGRTFPMAELKLPQ